MGALINPFYIMGYLMTLSFSYSLMMSSIMGKLYAFEAKFDSEKCKEEEGTKKSSKTKKGKDKASQKAVERDQENQLKPAYHKIKEAMRKTLYGMKRAAFKYKTCEIISGCLCLRSCRSRKYLSNSPSGRNILYYQLGLERMNKECDLGYIIRNIRVLRFFLTTVLSKD